MPLGTEVNVGPGNVVLDWVAAPPKRGTAPIFRFISILWPNGWMDEDATWYLGPGHIILDGVPALSEMGTAAPLPPLFGRSMSIVVTVAHLSYC